MCAVDCEEIKIFHGEICFGACSKVATGVATHQPIGKTGFHHGSKQDLFIHLCVAMVRSRTYLYLYMLPWFQAVHLHTSMCCCGSEQHLFIYLCVAMVPRRTYLYIYVLPWF